MTYMMPIVTRDYKFSDGTLEQLADIIAANLTRDLADLAARGITAATVTNLQGLRTAFSDTPTDDEARALVTTAVEEKNAAREAALVPARALRTAAQNVFGEDTGKYKRFGFKDMNELPDNELPRAMRRMKRVGTALLAELATEGIDAAFLTAFGDDITAFDDSIENVRIAEEERDVLGEERAEKGNILYKEIVRVCNIGKDVYAPISESKYNDYVIERFIGTRSGNTVVYEGNLTSPGTAVILTPGIIFTMAMLIKLEMNGTGGRGYFADIAGNPPGPGQPFMDVQGGQNATGEAGADWGYFAGTRTVLSVQNIGMTNGTYKITIYLA